MLEERMEGCQKTISFLFSIPQCSLITNIHFFFSSSYSSLRDHDFGCAQAASGQKGSFDAGEHPMAISARNAQAAAAAAEAAMAKGGDTTEAQAYQVLGVHDTFMFYHLVSLFFCFF
jgi:hypothetical protein